LPASIATSPSRFSGEQTRLRTKTQHKKALAREQKEQRTVMLPLMVGDTQIPKFLEDKIYIDLRGEYFSRMTQLVGI
jgi:hypothetical protein